jgi:hypothetical protein
MPVPTVHSRALQGDVVLGPPERGLDLGAPEMLINLLSHQLA